MVMEGDRQVASQVGLHLLGDLADRAGLTSAYSAAVAWPGERAPGHDRGKLLTQLAVMLAGGGECVSDLAALRDQPALFGEVASAPTTWRAVHDIDHAVLDALRRARASARAVVWAGGGAPEEVILDVDAALVEVHSANKEQARSHFKGGFGFHPMVCFLDATGEALSGILRAGNATANSGADQLTAVDLAIEQLPEEYRAGHRPGDDPATVAQRIVVRADSAGAVAGFIDGLVERNVEFSIYARVNDALHQAIAAVPADSWAPAVNAAGEARHAGEVAELDVDLASWPAGTRAICRREQPHPGAQLRLWDTDDGVTRSPSPTARATLSAWSCASVATPGSRTASRRCETPDWTACPSQLSPPMPPGSSSCSQAPTCWPGCATSASTPSWPGPNRRASATGCCTSAPASCAGPGVSSSASRSTGRGRMTCSAPTGA